jgi:hypothetical protein
MAEPDISAVTDGLNDPASASADGQSVSARPIGDLIAGEQFAAVSQAMTTRRKGLRFTRVYNAGPVRNRGDRCRDQGWP